ncbi:hypothetical protein WAI453_012268 [Rhynchosporium graminicola]
MVRDNNTPEVSAFDTPANSGKDPPDPETIRKQGEGLIRQIKSSDYVDRPLHSLFKEIYEGWTVDSFKSVKKSSNDDLIFTLRTKGVFIEEGDEPAQELYKLLYTPWDTIRSSWTLKELESMAGEKILSARLQYMVLNPPVLEKQISAQQQRDEREKEMINDIAAQQDELEYERSKKEFHRLRQRRRTTLGLPPVSEFDFDEEHYEPPQQDRDSTEEVQQYKETSSDQNREEQRHHRKRTPKNAGSGGGGARGGGSYQGGEGSQGGGGGGGGDGYQGARGGEGEYHDTVRKEKEKSYGKEIASFSRMFPEEMKFKGDGDSFSSKVRIFYDACLRAEIPPEEYSKAFPLMLKGAALQHYYYGLNSVPGTSLIIKFDTILKNMMDQFESEEFSRSSLTTWNLLTLESIKEKNPGKTTSECFDILSTQIRELRHSIPFELRHEKFVINKVITACQSSEACQIALAQPTTSTEKTITSIRTSIVNYEHAHPATSTTFYTNRKFRSDSDKGQAYGEKGDSKGRFRIQGEKKMNTLDKEGNAKKCWVCNATDHMSFDHTVEEREKAKEKFKAKNSSKFKGNFGRVFEKAYRQYVAEYEGTEDEYIATAFTSCEAGSDTDYDSDAQPETLFMTSMGPVSVAAAQLMTETLANTAFKHLLDTAEEATEENLTAETMISSPRYNSSVFHGIMIDTGAAKVSTVGKGQYEAYKALYKAELLPSRGINVKFGIGKATSIGMVIVPSPIGKIQFEVMATDTPFLLCLDDMDKLRVILDNLRNVLVTPQGDIPVVRRFGHLFLLWKESLETYITECFQSNTRVLTETDLRRLHHRFGHPSVRKLEDLLQQAGHEHNSGVLKELTKLCKHCQLHGRSPGRFKFKLHDTDNIHFNYEVVIDIMQLDGRQVLHIVDQGTTFQNGGFLTNISAEHVWNRFKQVWIDTYLGPPDFIVTDAGTQFKSKEFVQSAKTEGSTVKVVPVEAHHSIGKVERYHGPLKRAYTIIRKELPHLSQDMALQMAFHAINCISGPSGIVPVLLVFGAYPRMVEMDAPSPSVSQRAAALHKAIEEIRKLRSRRQVNDALNTRNGPSSTVVRDLPLNSLVLVWREKGFWDGPWPLISTDGENCVVEIDSGPTTFRSTSIKPWYEEDIDSDEPESIIPEIILSPPPVLLPGVPSLSTTKSNRPILVPKKQPHRDRRKPIRFRDDNVEVYLNYTDELFIGFPVVEPQYAASRRKEIDGLIAAGIFELVHKDELPAGARVFNAKFIDQTKFEGTQKAYEKSRLVVQAYNDSGKNQVLTTSPTIQRVSQRLLLVYAVMHPEFKVYSRDITQAYTQSTSHLIRDFFVRPPKEILAWLHWFLRCVGPMYGVPESANHWFGTYHGHKVKKLHMVPSTFDTCLLSVSGEAGTGALGLQIDDTFFVGNKTFIDAEERELQKAGFKSNEREQLTTLHPIDFNGGHITLETDGSIRLSQQSYDKTLRIIEKEPVNLTNSRGGIRQGLTQIEQFAAQRARGSYLATVSQPEASFDVSFAAQTMNPTEKDFELLNKRILWQKLNCSKGLRYVKLDKKSLKLVVFTDGSFANLKDFHSQIGYVCVLTDKYNKANVIHWSSVCCKRVTRSVLASELYAMSEGFDMAGAIKTTIEQIMEITVLPLIMVTDSKSLYDCVVRLNTTREKRLMIDLMCLRQAYERKEISEVIWVAGPDNPADAMTKTNCNGALKELLHTNQLVIKPMEWVDRGNLDDLKPEESL